MAEEKKLTVQEAHQAFATGLFNKTWDILMKKGRTLEDNEEMIHCAHASLYHWSKVTGSTPLNIVRGAWMLGHVYAILKRPEAALYHANRCLELTLDRGYDDFDLAYAYEGVARANACAGTKAACLKAYDQAEKSGDQIKKDGDKKQFMSDLHSEPWYGMKK